MTRLLAPFLLLALAVSNICAENFAPEVLIPRLSEPWQPASATAATAATAAAPAEIIAEPKPGHFYLFHPVAAQKNKPAHTEIRHSTDRANFGLTDPNGASKHLVAIVPATVTDVTQKDTAWQVTARDGQSARTTTLTWSEIAPVPARSKAAGRPIRVALFDDYGSFGKGVPRVTELLGKKDDIAVTAVKPPLIREGGLKDFDVVIFTGGSGSKQANTLGLLGREQVRRFIEAGGGYIGICAGNYLACEGYSWGLKVLDAKTKSSKWARGVGDVKIEFTEKGREILGMPEGILDIRYANGPVFNPAGADGIGDFEPLAYFRSELAKNGAPVGAQVNSPAMVIGNYGQGRVLCSSPHPEQQPGMENFVERAVRWVAGG